MKNYGIFNDQQNGGFSWRKMLTCIVALLVLYQGVGFALFGFKNFPGELWTVVYMVVTYYFLKNANMDKIKNFVKKDEKK